MNYQTIHKNIKQKISMKINKNIHKIFISKKEGLNIIKTVINKKKVKEK